MPPLVDRYRIHITVGTAVVCIFFLVGTSFRLGAEQTKVEGELSQNRKDIQDCKQKSDEQAKINSLVSGSLIEIKRDLLYIKEKVDRIEHRSTTYRGREADDK